MVVEGSIDYGNTHKTSDYVRNMDIDVKNIYKMVRIHGGPSIRKWMHFILERLNYVPNNLLITVKTFKLATKKSN